MSVTKVTKSMMADESIGSDNYVDGSIDNAHISTNQIDETLMKDAFVGDFTDATVTASDYILHGDATDSGNTKKDTVQGILDLVPVASSDCVRIATTTLASGASSITMDNCFSATYTYYMIKCMMIADGGISPRFRLLDSSGAELTASNWSWAGTMSYRSSSASAVGTCSGWGSDFLSSLETMSNDANMKHMWNIDVADPFGSGFDCSVHGFSNLFDGTYWRNSTMEGAYTTHATYRGFKLYVSSGNLLAGTEVSVYGLTNS
jgi:hypothetical protein